jgi:hypothetical protein
MQGQTLNLKRKQFTLTIQGIIRRFAKTYEYSGEVYRHLGEVYKRLGEVYRCLGEAVLAN